VTHGTDGDRGCIGPKAESLRALAAAGLPAPAARFLDCDAYREHAARAGVPELLAGAVFDPDAVREAILRTPLDARVAATLAGWRGELGDGHLAVRSSADAEDLPHASFAGQHGTFFVAAEDELDGRVLDCWASLFSDRAVDYRLRHGIPHDGVAMAVVVQALVPAVAAGVAFTVDPLDGSPDLLVEACFGIGETLVSGRVTPDRFVFDRADGLPLRSSIAGDKPVRLVVDGTNAIVSESVSRADAAELCMSEAVAREVARLALAAEGVVGGPADVEWAWDGERVWLLQARPVTALHVASAPSEHAAPAERDTTIWSNVNTGEILPDVATPMTWSIIYGHADDIVGGMFSALGVPVDAQRIIGRVGGRIYFNLTDLRESFSNMPGLNPDTALGGLHDFVELPPLPPVRTDALTKARTVMRAAVRMPAYVLRHTPRRAERFAAHMRDTTGGSLERIAAVRTPEEALGVVRSLNEEFSEFNDMLAYMAVAMFGFLLLGALTRRWFDDATGALANKLVAGQGEVASADAGHEMWRLSSLAKASPRVHSAVLLGIGFAGVRDRLEAERVPEAAGFLAAWDAFMAEHGHHRRGELEFANPTWAETPDYVLGIVRSYLAEDRGSDPMAAYRERAEEAERAAAESLAGLRNPLKRALFRAALRWGRASARTRENMKSEGVRWLVAIRHSLLALGRLMAGRGTLAAASDIFFLDYDELGALVADTSTDWRPIVTARRAEHERLEALTPPPVVVGEWDESATWTPTVPSRTLKGISVSSGVVRGRARVFLTADADEPVLPGEILVAPFTDPGWTPYFVPAAGIVMDMGGLLSHGSIIAREYGIPAVVNVGPATRIISTGQLIEVDGDAGEVRILG